MAIPFEDSIVRTTNQPRFVDERFDTLANRDAYADTLRYEGMLVYVQEDQTSYRLKGGIENEHWQVDGGGGGTAVIAYFEGDGVETEFELPEEYEDGASLRVYITGVRQKPDSYSVVSGFLTFSEAPPLAHPEADPENILVEIGGVTNVVPGGGGTPDDDSVTIEKMAPMNVETAGGPGALGDYVESSSSGAYTRTSTSPDVVTNLEVELAVRANRPVWVGLQPTGSGGTGIIEVERETTQCRGHLNIRVNGVANFNQFNFGTKNSPAASFIDDISNIRVPCSAVWFIHVPTSDATITYDVVAAVGSGSLNETISITNCKLVAFQM